MSDYEKLNDILKRVLQEILDKHNRNKSLMGTVNQMIGG